VSDTWATSWKFRKTIPLALWCHIWDSSGIFHEKTVALPDTKDKDLACIERMVSAADPHPYTGSKPLMKAAHSCLVIRKDERTSPLWRPCLDTHNGPFVPRTATSRHCTRPSCGDSNSPETQHLQRHPGPVHRQGLRDTLMPAPHWHRNHHWRQVESMAAPSRVESRWS